MHRLGDLPWPRDTADQVWDDVRNVAVAHDAEACAQGCTQSKRLASECHKTREEKPTPLLKIVGTSLLPGPSTH